MTVPSQSRAIPITPEDIVESSVLAHSAGAAIVHLHVREPTTGRPVASLDLFRQVMDEIRTRCDAIVQLTTGGAAGMSLEDRAQVIPALRPEMATLNLGSINFALHRALRDGRSDFHEWETQYLEATRDNVFRNSFADIEMMCALFQTHGVIPECEAYDVGHLYNLRYLIDNGLLALPVHLQFVLGVLGGNAGTVEQLLHMKATAVDLFGESFTWSVAGVGYPTEFHLAAASMISGGNVRVGLEDNLRISPDQYAESNADLVKKASALARLLDRSPMTSAEARNHLNLTRARAVISADSSQPYN